MLRIEALRPDTRALFELLDATPAIADFTLIGGTALALHVAHRESEDLDFVYTPRAENADRTRLPLATINALLDGFRNAGHTAESLLDQFQLDTAENEGFYLPDSHQDWAIDGVKLTFFAGDTAERKRMFHTLPVQQSHAIKLLTSDAIFETKARLVPARTTTRDLFDLWYFLDRERKTVEEIIAFALDERPYYNEEMIKQRLLKEAPSPLDPGFKPLLKDVPQNFDQLSAALTEKISAYERRVAAAILSEERNNKDLK